MLHEIVVCLFQHEQYIQVRMQSGTSCAIFALHWWTSLKDFGWKIARGVNLVAKRKIIVAWKYNTLK